MLISEDQLTELDRLALKYGVGKGPNWICYTNTYDKYFQNIKYDVKNLLEIGVEFGNSIKMWREFFLNANIYGLDKNNQCSNLQLDRIKIFTGDQSDSDDLDKIINETNCSFDIIIDDASHKINDMIFTFDYLFNRCLISGGIYIIEDIQVDYFEEKHRNFIQFLVDSVNLSELYKGNRNYYDIRFSGGRDAVIDAINSNKIDEIYIKNISEIQKNIDSFYCHRGFYIIFKR